MSVVCIICQDSLAERPQTSNNNNDAVACALKCGHLFHHSCVQQWFRSNGGISQRPGYGTCPSCKDVTSLSQTTRIYPTGDDDGNSVVEESKKLTALITDNQKLEARLKDVMHELSSLRVQHEKEVAEHELLKVRHAEVVSTVEELEDQLRDLGEINMAMGDSVKSVVEKLEKDKNEALKLVERLQISD